MIVNEIMYLVKDEAAIVNEGFKYNISLLKNDIIVWSDEIFGGSREMNGWTIEVPSIEADKVKVVAYDIEIDSHFIVINNVEFRIPKSKDNETIEYEFSLQKNMESGMPPIVIGGVVLGTLYILLKKKE